MSALGDDELLARVHAGTRSFVRWLGRGAADSRLWERDGVVASIVPSSPQRSVLNCVAYEDGAALIAAVDELAGVYERAGVAAWTVWTPEADRDVAAALDAAGHRLDAAPRAMGLALESAAAPPGEPPRIATGWDMRTLAEVNEAAYGMPAGQFSAALAGADDADGAHMYSALDGGETVAVLVFIDRGDDCVFTFAATLPDHRGRGHASHLLARACADGARRGMRTCTCKATAAGAPVYGSMGFRDLGAVQMWERRGG